MNRIDRLFAILLKISDGKLFQVDKLAAEFELSERTIYRDMSALIQMGIPIQSEAGVGYQLWVESKSLPISQQMNWISLTKIF